MNTKVCPKCGHEKSVECFYRKTASKDGLQHSCKLCSKNISRNRESRKEYNKEWRAKNRQHINELRRTQKYKEKNNQYKRIVRARDKQKHYMKVKAWAENNKDLVREYKRKTGRRYVNEIHDSYIKNLLRIPTNQISNELLELKRQQIDFFRLFKQLTNVIKEKTNAS